MRLEEAAALATARGLSIYLCGAFRYPDYDRAFFLIDHEPEEVSTMSKFRAAPSKTRRLADLKTRIEVEGDARNVSLPTIHKQTARAMLEHEANKPLRGGDRELGADSLFGDAHLQTHLFGG